MVTLLADASLVLDTAHFGAVLLLKVAALLAVAWGLAWWLRDRSAALRHGIWSLAVVLVLLLPLLSAGLPAWQVTIPDPPWRPMPENAAPPAMKAVAPEEALRPSEQEEALSVDARVFRAPPAEDAEAFPHEEAKPAWTGWLIGFYTLAVWSGGTVLLLAWLALHALHVYRFTRRAWSDPASEATQRVADVRAQLGIRRPVRLLFSGDVVMPVTWGLGRPIVLLPEAARAWPPERLRVVLLHELAHIARWDYLSHLVTEIACALYWPNPLVWLARSRVRAEQEQACDDRVLRAGTRSYEYAEHLLEIVRVVQNGRWSLRGTVAMAREADMKGRIRAILDGRTSRHPLTPQAAFLLGVVLIGFAFPMAAMKPQAAVPAEEEDASEEPSSTEVAGTTEEEEPREGTPSYLWMQAEAGSILAPMTVQTDLDASSGRYVAVPDGEGNDAPEGGSGSVQFTFEVDRAGEYVVWGRVIGKGGNDNSFYVAMDDGPEGRWDVLDDDGEADVDDWTWLPVASRREERSVVLRYQLEEGTHTLRVRNREDGTRLDRLLITDDLEYAPEGRGPALKAVRLVYLWAEAEAAEVTAPVRAREDRRASGGQYVQARRNASDGEGAVAFLFDVAQAGPYVIWGRILAPDDDENSFFVSVGDGEEEIWDVPGREKTSERWTWDPVSARRKGEPVNPVIFNLEPGRHTLRVRNRETGTRLDGILITNDLSYRPRGTRPAPPPAQPAYVWLEAEEASHQEAPLRTFEGREASAGRYVEARGEDAETPPAGGQLRYAFDISWPGAYTVWGRVIARDSDEDSFWIRVDGGPWIRWNDVRHGERWRWDEVHDSDYGKQLAQFEFSAGAHTLEIAHREGGAALDKLLITNDPHFVPEGISMSD